MKLVTSFSIIALAGALASPVHGQAIVDATGLTAGSVQTITEALNGTESEIIVKNTGVYQEALMITRDVVLRGEDPANRPVVALKGNPTQPSLGTGDGIYAGGTVGGTADLTIDIRDMIFIPNLDGSIADDGFSITPNVGAVLNYTMHNVLSAPNDGTDKPLATSVWDNPAGGTRVPGAWFYLMDNAFGGFDGDIHTTVTDCTFIGAGTDGTVFYPGEGGSIYISGMGTSYCGRYGSQTSNEVPLTITGSKENPGWVARECLVGLILFESGEANLDNLVIVDTNNTGLRVDANSVVELNLSESLFANNLTQGLYIPSAHETAKSWTVSDCTFINNGANTGAGVFSNIQITSTDPNSANLTLTVTDSIFAGPSAPGVENQGLATVNVSYSALVTEGLHALPSATLGTVNLSNVINSDPLFASIDTDPLVEASFDVTAVPYGNASSTGGNLNGWGEGPNAAVGEWSLY